MIDNSLPPTGKFYTEAKANEMVAEECKKWLECIEKIKKEIEAEYGYLGKDGDILTDYGEGLRDATKSILDIIDKAIKECDT